MLLAFGIVFAVLWIIVAGIMIKLEHELAGYSWPTWLWIVFSLLWPISVPIFFALEKMYDSGTGHKPY